MGEDLQTNNDAAGAEPTTPQPQPGRYDHLFTDEPTPPTLFEARNRQLEASFNAGRENPLPPVSLQAQSQDELRALYPQAKITRDFEKEGTNTYCYVIKGPDNQPLGFAVLKNPHQKIGSRSYNYLNDIEIVDEERGKGYGPATYLAVLKSLPINHVLRTEGVLSTDSLRLWQDLVARGIATKSPESGSATGFETIN